MTFSNSHNQCKSYVEIIADYYLRRKGSKKNPRGRERHFFSESFLSLIPTKGKILDAGCGNGELAEILYNTINKNIVCVDFCDELISLARDRGLPKVIKMDLNNPLKFSDNSFDFIIAKEVVEHLYNPWKFFAESFRILKPGGKLLITTINNNYLKIRLKSFLGFVKLDHDLKKFTATNLRNILKETSFVNINIQPTFSKKLKHKITRLLGTNFFSGMICIAEKPTR